MRVFLFFIIFFASSSEIFAFKEIDLVVGEKKSLELGFFSSVEVSRRGYVEISKDPKSSKWHLVGMRSGFVIISFYALPADKEPSEKIYLSILRNDVKHKYPEMAAFCQMKGLFCDEELFHIKGVTDEPEVFLKTKAFCSKKQGCLFFLRLSELGKENLKRQIAPFLFKKTIDLQVQDDGSLFLKSYIFCNKSKDHDESGIDLKYLEKAFPYTFMMPICDLSQSLYYEVKGKVFLISASLAKSLGFGSHLSYENQKGQLAFNLSAIIESLEKERKIQVLAQPSLEVVEGVEGSLHSGGELPYIEENSKKEENQEVKWKQTGIKMQATVKVGFENNVLLDYKFFLKSKKDDGSLLAHEFVSQIKMDLFVPRVVGFAEIQQEDASVSGSLFTQIPIIGPLFKKDREDGSNVQIFLWMEVKRI